MIYPTSHGLVGDHNSPLGQQVLDIAEAQRETGIKPDGLLDDHRREAIPTVADFGHQGR
jgi:hypothetical protein